MKNSRSAASVVLALFLIAASFMAGAWFGFQNRPEVEKIASVLGKNQPADLPEVDFNPFWKTWRLIEQKHVGEEKLDRNKLVWGATEGMVKSLGDPYTIFFPPRELDNFQTELKAEFSGIGAEIGIRKDVLTVISPLKNSPAERAGLKAGDKILKVDDLFTSELTLDEAVGHIRGKRGTKVDLTILRNGEEDIRVITITRDKVELPVIETKKRDDGVFVISIFSFSENSSFKFNQAVREFLRSGYSKLVIDLRNNPGGFLSSAVDMASWFIPEGDVIVREEFSDKEQQLYRSRGYGALENTDTVILINGGSASASEILAGALSEYGKVTLIGEKSFGKGSVQELEAVTQNTSLKVTVARWLTPNGVSISKGGLTPDIEVKMPKDAKEGSDPQLERAVKFLITGS